MRKRKMTNNQILHELSRIKKILRRKKKKRNIVTIIPKRKLEVPRSFRRNILSKYSLPKAISNKYFLDRKDTFINKNLPTNLKYLITVSNSPLNFEQIKKENFFSNGIILVPEEFSILDNPNKSYLVLKQLISALLIENNDSVLLDYRNCKKVELSTQVLLDIILKDFWSFRTKINQLEKLKSKIFPSIIGGINIYDEEIQKLLFSVGSPTILNNTEKKFKDIIPYKLCIHNNEKEKDFQKRIEQKEIDTTEMADYVIECLKRMNKKMTRDKLNDLCTVIGEILINAEEHSTTKYRFSIGYFKEETGNENHFGVFRLVILNFGNTIYEKFKSEDCPNQDIVERMKLLSQNYTKKNWFSSSEFEEENLWTLYALQEGVTSIAYDKHKRGNGSIRFIESFFNIKGSQVVDDISRMSIVSGKTRIIFDGFYNISSKTNINGEIFKVMTFNNSENIEDKPDNKYVYCMDNYFPGTFVSARILLNDDDLKQIKI